MKTDFLMMNFGTKVDPSRNGLSRGPQKRRGDAALQDASDDRAPIVRIELMDDLNAAGALGGALRTASPYLLKVSTP